MTEDQKQRFAEALARVAGDCELLAAMAAMVAEDAPVVMQELRENVAAKELPKVAATAHKLKGMLSTFDTTGPVLELEELISSARKGQAAEVASLFRAFERRIKSLLDEILALA